MTQPWVIALALEVPEEVYEYIKYEVLKLENTIEEQKKEIKQLKTLDNIGKAMQDACEDCRKEPECNEN